MKLKPLLESDRYGSSYSTSRRRRRMVVRSGDGDDDDDDVERLLSVLLARDGKGSKRNCCALGFLACAACQGWLEQPVTLACGHTCCRRCASSRGVCCCCCRTGDRRGKMSGCCEALKVNVLVQTLLDKWANNALLDECAAASDHAEALKSRRANELCYRRRPRNAPPHLIQAAADDHHWQSSLTLALMQAGHFQEAFERAEHVVRTKPNWSEGYYQMAICLHCLGRYDDAVIAYLQCLILNPDMLYVKHVLLKKLLKKVVKAKTRRNSLERPLLPYPVNPRVCRSNPGSSTHRSDDSDRSSGDDEGPLVRRQLARKLFANGSAKTLQEKGTSLFKNPHVQKFVSRCLMEISDLKKSSNAFESYSIDPKLVDKSDFECTLCYRLFWEPVTTPCGHVFCRTCLDRCLDHNPLCPLCKTSLFDYLAERRRSITVFIECAMQRFLPDEYRERQALHKEELAELACAGIDAQHEVPVFVCTMAFPTVPCPLHVFEPRYRLMIRRCMESGAKKFGMCTSLDDSSNGFADYGTMVEIREVQYFPDGRAIINTVGNQRFRVVRKGMRDGYNTASVEFLVDDAVQENDLNDLHNTVHDAVTTWFAQLHGEVQARILAHFGAMPEVEDGWPSLGNGPAWYWWAVAILPLDQRAQLSILAMTSLRRRLETLQRIMNYLRKRRSC